jgi:ribosomal protein S19
MSRSIWKFKTIHKNLYLKLKKKKKIILKNRSSEIIPFFEKKNIFVYNGKFFRKIYINRYMFKHKIGEFFYTKRMGRKIHEEKKKDKKKKKK